MGVKLTVRRINIPRKLRRAARRDATWWVVGLPYDECGTVRCGPYITYAEARSDCDGLQRFFEENLNL